MRPRVAFALVLGAGALLHIPFLGGAVRQPLPLMLYLAWLAVAASTVAACVVHARRQAGTVAGGAARAGRVEGLWLVIVPAAAALFFHVATAMDPSMVIRRYRNAMWLCFFALAVAAWIALRKKYSAEEPPIPDRSPLARAFAAAQHVVGAILCLIGAGMGYLGWTAIGSSDSLTQAATLFMLAGGAALILIGLAVIYLRLRDDRR